MNERVPAFRPPNPLERTFNRAMGALVGLGLGPRDYYLLQVRGRKSGRLLSTPVNVIEIQQTRFLVAPRGRTQWVRNAEAAGEVALKRGREVRRYRLRAIPDIGKPSVLRAYLKRFKTTVQRYFPVRAGAPPDAFTAIAPRYPVFELLSLDDER
jgi:deazaflavin-dependent oxidoreductase (nitroreductase family)